jgi:DNA ligase 1
VPSTLLQFAQVNDSAAATPKKLAKQAILADYFRTLDDDDLRRAVRFAIGRPFPATDERTLNVGGAIVSDVILSILKIDPHKFHELIVRSGEIGEALATAWPANSRAAGSRAAPPPVLSLADIAQAFDDLSATGNIAEKKSILQDLFTRCTHPREAAYLAKIIFGDLRTGVQDGVLQAAIAVAFEKQLADIQSCQLLVGDLDEVAVLAKRDQLNDVQFRLFHPIQFMLATPQETADIAAETMARKMFYAEDKLDGIRAQIHKQGDRIAIYTRTMDRTDESFPDVVDAIAKLPGDFLLDGEIVPYRDGVVLPFAHIQRRLGRKTLSRKILRENPTVFIAFDILYRNGTLLMDQPLHTRRAELQRLAQESSDRLLITKAVEVTTPDQITAAFDKSRLSRNEGLVLKDPFSIYSPGRRGQMWLKLKTHLPTFDCVVTAAEYGYGKRCDSLSDYTFAVWDREPTEDGAKLVNIGKAFSGVTDVEIAQLTKLFLEISLTNNGRVHQVEPKIVLEIACDQIQKSNRHASGYALRFPRIKRIRWDKKPVDADRLARIIEIYQSTHNFGRTEETGAEPQQPTLFDGM